MKIIITGGMLLIGLYATAKDNLKTCTDAQIPPAGQYLAFDYSEKKYELHHSFEPWQKTKYASAGTTWCNGERLVQTDSMKSPWGKVYYSTTDWRPGTLLWLDYDEKELTPVTQAKLSEFIYKCARYNPAPLLHYFAGKKAKPNKESSKEYAVYELPVNDIAVRLKIRKADNLLQEASTLEYDELHGDIRTTYHYQDYQKAGSIYYPAAIYIDKIGGRVKDTVILSAAKQAADLPALLDKPADYKIQPAPAPIPDTVTVRKHSEGLYFVELKSADEQVALVEFDDYWLVADAPLNSANGELIIKEAEKIAPGKPIKYFVFSHYHPHYTGGIRPFVQRGATVLTTADDIPYIIHLATAPHSLKPDKLHLEPKALKTDTVGERKIITDGKMEMHLVHLGAKSDHTKDYIMYYFPAKKLLIEGDLVWIPKEGPVKKARNRQKGVYQAIKDMNLQVDTIIQSWGVNGLSVKTTIPFSDLEASMNAE